MAERLWSNPDHDWKEAEYRMIYHRDRMVERGIKADALQPFWCAQNAGHCYFNKTIKTEEPTIEGGINRINCPDCHNVNRILFIFIFIFIYLCLSF